MPDDQFEKTEPATPRKRKKFKERGQIAKSREVPGVLVIVGTLIYFYFAGDVIYEGLGHFWHENFRMATEVTVDLERMQLVMWQNVNLFLKLLIPYFIMVAILASAGHIVQSGFMLTTKPLLPDLNRVNPVAKFKQLFLSMRLFTESTINIIKVTVLGIIVYLVISSKMDDLYGLVYLTPGAISQWIIDGVMEILLKTAMIFVFVALLDYLFNWWKQEKDMRMSRQELKDELKETEGDPYQKGHQRQRMREISLNKMIETVPNADVIVTNPTHIAVALRYKSGDDEAPTVVAKGQGFWAERIKEIGREHGVAIMEDKLLARSLFKSVKIGGSIPKQLYRAVAELLAQVYALQNKRKPTRKMAR